MAQLYTYSRIDKKLDNPDLNKKIHQEWVGILSPSIMIYGTEAKKLRIILKEFNQTPRGSLEYVLQFQARNGVTIKEDEMKLDTIANINEMFGIEI